MKTIISVDASGGGYSVIIAACRSPVVYDLAFYYTIIDIVLLLCHLTLTVVYIFGFHNTKNVITFSIRTLTNMIMLG